MRSVKNAAHVKPNTVFPASMRYKVKPSGTVAAGDLLVVTGVANDLVGDYYYKVALASNATKPLSQGMLLIAKHAMAASSYGEAFVSATKAFNTNGATIGDPVYLSTAGAPTLTATGYQRRVGTVLIAATAGLISLAPGYVKQTAGTILARVDAVAGAATLVLSTVNLGGNFDGSPVVATANTVDGTKFVQCAVWNGSGQLTITLSASYTGNVSTIIWA